MTKRTPRILQHDRFTNPSTREKVNRLVLDVNGHTVQIVQTDNSPRVLVKVDDTIKQVDISQAGKFIQTRTQDGNK